MATHERDDAPAGAGPAVSLGERLASLERVVTCQQEELAAQRALSRQQQEELAAQRERADHQNAVIERLRAGRAEAAPAPVMPLILPASWRGRGAASDAAAPERAEGRRPSRRALLKLGGVAAAAGVVAGAGELLRPGTARAAGARPLDNLISGSSSVNLVPAVNGTGTNGAEGVYGSSDTSPGVWGYSNQGGDGVYGQAIGAGHGVLGITDSGYGVEGFSSSGTGGYLHAGGSGTGATCKAEGGGVGVYALSVSGIDLYAGGTGRFQQALQASEGPPASGAYFAGEQIRDSNGDLWICVQTSIPALHVPALWRKLDAPQVGYAGGSLNLLGVAIRLLDTRGGSPVAYHGTAQFRAAGVGAIPTGTVAVFGHLTAALRPGVNPGDGSSAILWPAGQTRPAAVNIVYNGGDLQGEYTGTLALVAVGAGGQISLYSQPILPGVAVDYLFDCFGFVM